MVTTIASSFFCREFPTSHDIEPIPLLPPILTKDRPSREVTQQLISWPYSFLLADYSQIKTPTHSLLLFLAGVPFISLMGVISKNFFAESLHKLTKVLIHKWKGWSTQK